MRAIISLNWLLGTLFLLIAFVYPILDQKFLTGAKQTAAEMMVDRIVEMEQRNFQIKNQYVLFSDADMPSAVRKELGLEGNIRMEFSYSVSLAENGDLLVRARATDREILADMLPLPPLVYIYRKANNGNKITREWSKWPGAKRGLF